MDGQNIMLGNKKTNGYFSWKKKINKALAQKWIFDPCVSRISRVQKLII